MPSDTITIRSAVIADTPFIKACIHELAEYEHAEAQDQIGRASCRERV